MYPVLTPSHCIGSLFEFMELSTGYPAPPQKSIYRNTYTSTYIPLGMVFLLISHVYNI